MQPTERFLNTGHTAPQERTFDHATVHTRPNRRSSLRLAFASDRNVLQHLAVAILSICEAHVGVAIEIAVVLIDVASPDMDRLHELVAPFDNVTLRCIPFAIDHPERFPIKKGHVSVAAYARIFLTDLLPPHWTKVLYLDCDVIVRRNLGNLWDRDLDGFAAAAVQEPGNSPRKVALDMPDAAPYFNSGVMLINLTYWREYDVKNLLLDYIYHNAEKLMYWDQDAINACLSLKMLPLPSRWNVTHTFYLGPFRDVCGMKARDLLSLQRDPAVVHFTGPTKPWMYIMTHPFQASYWTLLGKTPFRDTPKDKITVRTFLFRHLRIVHRAVKRVALLAFTLMHSATPVSPIP
jgi:lipopolysaccharide biosynthesis glycosyltransferase